MGQTVYVLMEEVKSKEGKEWYPVAVVSDATVAEQWGEYGKEVTWVPLELDDIKYLQPGKEEHGKRSKPQFQPRKTSPIEERAIETAKRLEETNAKLMEVIRQYEKLIKSGGKPKGVQRNQPAVKQPTSALLKKSGTIEEEAPDGSDNDTNGDSQG